MQEDKRIVIIGNGISGVTAARHIRKRSNYKITIISAETKYFFSRTALMYVYMGHMKAEHIKPYKDDFWKKNNIELVFDFVKKVDTANNQLHLSSNATIKYDELIIATGSKPNKFGWKGQDLDGVQGLYSWQDLELMEKNTNGIEKAVIAGGGLIGVEMAEMLRVRGIEVVFLVRESRFWGNVLPKEEGELVSKHIQHHGVDLRFNTELEEIIANENGRANAVKTKSGELIECQFVGITAGVSPNISFLKDSKIDLNRGVLVDDFLRTNISNIYAIGDCAEFKVHPTGRRNIEQVWYTGKMMGETIARTVCEEDTAYRPGHWFNSAKFFEIEYQTYGQVNAKLKENEACLYWESENNDRCIKLVYDKASNHFLGVNVFGIRMRHEVFDYWLNKNASIEEVIENLTKANFDPETFKTPLKEIQKELSTQFSKSAVSA